MLCIILKIWFGVGYIDKKLNTKRMPDFGFGLLQLLSLSIFPLMAIGLVIFVGYLIWHFLLLLYEAYPGKQKRYVLMKYKVNTSIAAENY